MVPYFHRSIRQALSADKVRRHVNYCVRVTADFLVTPRRHLQNAPAECLEIFPSHTSARAANKPAKPHFRQRCSSAVQVAKCFLSNVCRFRIGYSSLLSRFSKEPGTVSSKLLTKTIINTIRYLPHQTQTLSFRGKRDRSAIKRSCGQAHFRKAPASSTLS